MLGWILEKIKTILWKANNKKKIFFFRSEVYRLLDQHKDCHVSNLKKIFIFNMLDEVTTENSKLSRLPELLDLFPFDVLTVELTKVLGHLYLLYLSSLFWFKKKAKQNQTTQHWRQKACFFTLKTSKLNGDLILCFELRISPVSQFCQKVCILCHLPLCFPLSTYLHWSNQALQNSGIRNSDWIKLIGSPTC